jgi:hypothetical protein
MLFIGKAEVTFVNGKLSFCWVSPTLKLRVMFFVFLGYLCSRKRQKRAVRKGLTVPFLPQCRNNS